MIFSSEILKPLKRKDLKKALIIGVNAFLQYPVPGGFISDIKKRRIALYEMFKIQLKYALKKERVFTLGGDFKEFAVVKENALSAVKESEYIPYASFSTLRLLSAMSGREMKALNLALAESEKAKASLTLPEKTASILLLAVNPENQGQGRGGKLVKAIIYDLMKEGVSCLIETCSENNVKIYEKLGFTLIHSLNDLRAKLTTFFLLKKAEPLIR
jgi:ribosomal protein S18 acetylase RimI-like enzyme